MFDFPFNPDIWGTVSDWFMIVVTGITAFYLYKSLMAQQKDIEIQNNTLIEQQKITEIEQFIFKEKVKPIFELQVGHHEKVIDDLNKKARFKYSFNFYTHNAVAIDLFTTETLWNYNEPNKPRRVGYSRKELYPGMNSSNPPIDFFQDKIINAESIGADYAFRFSFNTTYKDVLGNFYRQEIILYEDSNKRYNLHQGGPQPITEEVHLKNKNYMNNP